MAFTPFETRADTIVRLAVRADELGVARVEVAEAWSHDSTILLAEIAQRTERIGLGTGILSMWGRTPATMALAAAGLQRCSGGRFRLGIGAGSPPLAEGFHGVPWDRPMAQLRRTVTAVRALLDGERLPEPVAGARALRLGVPPETRVPLALAALAPASIRLAGELADAWAPFLWARSRLADGRELLREGGDARVAVGLPVAIGHSEAEARRMAAWWLTTYLTRMGPLYPRLLGHRFGMTHAVNALLESALAQRSDLPAAAEALARDVTLLGTPDEAAAAIDAWFAAGADEVQLVLPPGHPEEQLEQIVALAAAAPSRA